MSKRTLAAAALAAFLTLGPLASGRATAAAEASAIPTAASDALLTERARLRAALDRVNAEIDALKRAGGGVRDDYRLRARLADAESLARKLIDIEARLGLHLDGGRAQPKPQPPPTAAATDGPADLDAKADILADQSRRLRVQADTLGRRATELKGRQELRRRVADLDRDPFAPMEGSKRRVASASTTTSAREAAPVAGGAGPTGGRGNDGRRRNDGGLGDDDGRRDERGLGDDDGHMPQHGHQRRYRGRREHRGRREADALRRTGVRRHVLHDAARGVCAGPS